MCCLQNIIWLYSSIAPLVLLQPVSSSMPRVAASVPDNLSLFLDPAAKAEEGTVKKLSKDSILSLYASAPSVSAHGKNSQMPHALVAYSQTFLCISTSTCSAIGLH